MRVRYAAHLPTLSLRDGENLRSILAGTVLPTLHGAVLCKNWHLCGACWEDCEQKRSHVPNPQRQRQPSLGCLRKPKGNGMRACSLAAAGRFPPKKPSPILH